MPLLIYFILLLTISYRNKSVSNLFILLQITSLSLVFLISKDLPINNPQSLVNISITAFILTNMIIPWKYYAEIKGFSCSNEHRINNVTKILLGISSILFIVLITTSMMVLTSVKDINYYRHAEGVLQDFMLSNLPPIIRKGFILAYYIYPISYFLIPLHFYYLNKKENRLAIICFIFSLNIILFGLTFFSRWTITHYALLYLTFYFLLKGALNINVKRKIKFVFLVLTILLLIRFADISEERFFNDISYEKNIPESSKIQDVVIYNYIDYFSQWYNNNVQVLENYNYKTLAGEATFYPILTLLNDLHILDYNSTKYTKERQDLMKEYWYTFNGLVADWIYDFGYLISIIFALTYNQIIKKLRPYNNTIPLNNTFILVLLIQLPLFAIFYSFLGGIMIAIFMWIILDLYLRAKIF